MKKIRVFLPLLVFVFAMVAVFALPTKPESSFKKDDPILGCIDQTECTSVTGPVCEFIVLDENCDPTAHRKN